MQHTRKRIRRMVIAVLAIPVLFYAHKPFYWMDALHANMAYLDTRILGYYVRDAFPMYNYPTDVLYDTEYYVWKLCRNLIHLLTVLIALDACYLTLLHRRIGPYLHFLFNALITLKGFMIFNLFMFLAADNQWNWYLQVYCLVAFLVIPHAFYMAFGKKYN